VINYDLPDSLQLFTHRVGRTGRMGKSGEAITFVTPDDESKWREIERGFDTKVAIKRWGSVGPDAGARPRSPNPAAKATQDLRTKTAAPVALQQGLNRRRRRPLARGASNATQPSVDRPRLPEFRR
jgi:superfamily II DNA/RNA helicase